MAKAKRSTKSKAAAKTSTAKKSVARTAARPGKGARPARAARRTLTADPSLFAALTEGERAEALRLLTEDKRLANMAKVD